MKKGRIKKKKKKRLKKRKKKQPSLKDRNLVTSPRADNGASDILQ